MCESTIFRTHAFTCRATCFKERTKSAVALLAAKGVFVGTSSWKYPGWCGMLYDEQRYVWRSKFAENTKTQSGTPYNAHRVDSVVLIR